MSIFEGLMLICFGISWPVSIAKALRTRTVRGKSPLFMMIVIVGYTSGVLHKQFYAYDWIIILYIINLVMVTFDLILYFYFSGKTVIADAQ